MRHGLVVVWPLVVSLWLLTSVALAGNPDIEERNQVSSLHLLTPSSEHPETADNTHQAARTTAHFFISLAPPPDPMTGREKLDYFLVSTFGVPAFLSGAALDGIKQARNTVPEWGQGVDGYGIRVASSVGQRIVRNTIHHGLGGLLNEDPRYYVSGRAGSWDRSLYALSQTFITHKQNGEARFAYTYMAGTVGSTLISRQWYPESNRTAEEYAYSIATSVGFKAVKNLFLEFWPDIKHRIFK
jgi:hypothetical protein